VEGNGEEEEEEAYKAMAEFLCVVGVAAIGHCAMSRRRA
jgi:hypothetical protein